MLEVRNLVKEFPGGTRAVDGVTFTVAPGEVFALVGESGCGKTTLARCVLGVLPITSGGVWIDGVNIASVRGAHRRRLQRRAQIVFQNPYAALNPRMTVALLVAEPLRLRGMPRGQVREGVVAALERVGLGAAHLDRYPHELSGGQCQRVAIARALALEPGLLVLDEPTSALDVSVQAQILNLLGELRGALGLAYLLISHDLAVVRHLADRIGVMRDGQLVEEGLAGTLLDTPRHEYTRSLLDAVPGRGRRALLAEADAGAGSQHPVGGGSTAGPPTTPAPAPADAAAADRPPNFDHQGATT